ncbi:YceI family protein [Phenylobacterium sp.]|uniref:YceI family protein n=1 Tax=Phenylobacterium sp. TaxID=1871053 RepID=UPI0035C7C703
MTAFKTASLASLAAAALLAACSQPAETPAETAAPEAAAETAVPAVPAGVYALDPTHTAFFWSVPHNGISNYTARFSKVEATLTLDPDDLANSKIEAMIDPTSVSTAYPGDYKGTHPNTGFQSWDENIAQGFLKAGQFPQITFVSTAVNPTGPRTAEVTGDLTFMGQTRPVTLNATFNGLLDRHPFLGVPAVGFAAEGSFKRSDFGMEAGPVGDEVKIRFDGEFVRQGDAAAPAAGAEG